MGHLSMGDAAALVIAVLTVIFMWATRALGPGGIGIRSLQLALGSGRRSIEVDRHATLGSRVTIRAQRVAFHLVGTGVGTDECGLSLI